MFLEHIIGVFNEAYLLFMKMSIYLLFGFVFAGFLHVYIKEELIVKHLGKNDFLSSVKAALFGVPLPLCSCSVVPTALSLKRQGASKGAVNSFLVSTPTTGIDSIFATYGLLGGIFTLYRVLASFLIGVFTGTITNIFIKDAKGKVLSRGESECPHCHSNEAHNDTGFIAKVKGAFKYAFVDLLKDVGAWLLLGVLLGGMITYFVPQSFIEQYLGQGLASMIIMLVIGIPMYVCATGSLPIAAALMLKGMNPGAAFVFLLVGPATNIASLTILIKELGMKTILILLASITISSLALGSFLNVIWEYLNIDINQQILGSAKMFPLWVEQIAGFVLLAGILINYLPFCRGKEHKHCC